MRNAEFRNTGAQNQYLIAINSFIGSCHQWSRFQITDEEYKFAKIDLSRWAENTMTSEAYADALGLLKEAFGQAPSADTAPYSDDGPDQVVTSSNEVMVRFDTIDLRLSELFDRLPPTPAPPTSRQSVMVRFGVDSALPESRSLDEVREVALSFALSCRRPQFVLVGYADASGTFAANVVLGLRRATNVRDLIHQGLDEGSFIAVSGGSTEQFGAKAAENRVVKVEMRCHQD